MVSLLLAQSPTNPIEPLLRNEYDVLLFELLGRTVYTLSHFLLFSLLPTSLNNQMDDQLNSATGVFRATGRSPVITKAQLLATQRSGAGLRAIIIMVAYLVLNRKTRCAYGALYRCAVTWARRLKSPDASGVLGLATLAPLAAGKLLDGRQGRWFKKLVIDVFDFTMVVKLMIRQLDPIEVVLRSNRRFGGRKRRHLTRQNVRPFLVA